MLLVLFALFAVAGIAPLIFRKLGRSTFYVLAAVPAIAFVWLLGNFPSFTDAQQSAASGLPNAPPSELYEWIGPLNTHLDFRMDALAAILCLLVLGVGALVLFYCARYFKSEDANIGTFGAQLLAFAGAMFGLVTADDMILMFIFWELTTILSYLLIGFNRTRMSARRSALTALIVTTFGGLTMLVGLVMLGQAAGTYRISEIMAMAPELVSMGTFIDVAILLVLVGAVSKSALVPFHFWLPGAMAAPTPVSAYLHAAAMVKAGVYLVARLAPGFNQTAFWEPMLLGLGLATLLIGGWRALKQHDLKLVLAYGTVSQLGFLILDHGPGQRERGAGGHGHDAGARLLQGDALPGGRHHRPQVRNPRPAPALRALQELPAALCRRGPGRGLHGRLPAAARLRDQGIGLRGAARVRARQRYARHAAAGRRGAGRGHDLRLFRALPLGRIRHQEGPGSHALPEGPGAVPGPAAGAHRGHRGLRLGARACWKTSSTPTWASSRPPNTPSTWASGTASPPPWG